MNEGDSSSLSRPLYQMPDYVSEALETAELMQAYNDRPPYQRNDYISWITRAKREDTRQRRLHQMLDELETGNVYMKMEWSPQKSRRSE